MQRVLVALIGMVIVWALSGVVGAWALTRRRSGPFAEPTPAGFTQVRLRSSDGLAIGGWLAEDEDDRVTIVLAHGNGASRTALEGHARALRELECAVMPITLRAHGDSDGDSNDLGWSARHDVIAAVDHLRARRPERPIVVLGSSLGAAAAVFAAEELGDTVAGYVLVAPYADLVDAVHYRTQRYLPPILDTLAFAALWLGGQLVITDIDRIRPFEAAARFPDVPMLIFAGGADDRAPVDDARRIADAAPRARVIVVEGADHDAVLRHVSSRAALREIEELVGRLVGGGG
jgi:pimeloyl-ACP methyl ester carboxylesterase